MLVPCWFTVFVFWPGHSNTKCQACFWMFLFCFEVVNQRENYKRTTFYCEMLSSRMGCSRLLTLCSRFAHACSRFAHALLTLCSRFAHALLTFCSRFAHALLTLCSRFAHARRGSFWVLTRFLLGPYEGLLKLRLIFKSEKNTHNPSLKRGCHTPASAWDMYVQRSFWAQRIQKVYPILWYYDMFLWSPKGPKSTSIDGIVQRSF